MVFKKRNLYNVFILRLILWRLFSKKKKVYAHIPCFKRWHLFNTLDQLAPPPPPRFIWFKTSACSNQRSSYAGVAFCHSRLNDFSPSSSSPGSLFSSLCLSKHQWTIPIKLFPSKTVDELQEFFFSHAVCHRTQSIGRMNGCYSYWPIVSLIIA